MHPLFSSPLTPVESSQTSRPPASQQTYEYRNAKALPFELAQHVQVYFEESMFTQGLGFLLSIVSSDAASDGDITVPAPVYLAVTSTITVHPSLTTRTTSRDKWEQANSASRLLRLLLKTNGPIQLAQSFQFTKYNRNDSDLNTYYADEGSLWALAEDFWAVVGWAMNCSCLSGMYTARWAVWSLWLEFMLEVLETDWRLRCTNDACEESLLWQYVELAPGGNTRARRMLRATFADGSTSSLNEFKPIFRRELREPPSDNDVPKKREVDVDIDADIYGDYLTVQNESSDSSDHEASRPSKRARTRTPSHRPTPKSSNQSLRSDHENANNQPKSALGSPQSFAIRLRLLNLLSQVACHPTLSSVSPTTFPSQDEIYTLFVEFIKPLPLPTFQQLVSPTVHSPLAANVHINLCEYLLDRTIEHPASIVHTHRDLTQSTLETEYLPYAASKPSIDANCRVSLVLETLIRRLKSIGLLTKRSELIGALETGINRRLNKSTADKEGAKRRKKGTEEGEEDLAWDWLVESGERMRIVVNM